MVTAEFGSLAKSAAVMKGGFSATSFS